MHRLALAALVMVMACRDKPPTEPPPLSGSGATAGFDAATEHPSGRARVALLDSGAEPREALRYSLNVGDKQTVVLRIRYTADSRVQASAPVSLKFPTMKLVFQVEIVEALQGDRARYRFELGEAALTEVEGADSTLLAMAGAALEKAQGIRGSAIVDSRGIIRDSAIELPDGLDPSLQVMLESMRTSMEQLALPLPADAVGVGARWEVAQTLVSAGTSLDHTMVLELASNARGKCELRATIEQNADRQDVSVPNIEAAELLSLTATGNATLELNLSRLAPTRASYHIESDSRFELTTEGRVQGLISKGTVDVSVSAQ